MGKIVPPGPFLEVILPAFWVKMAGKLRSNLKKSVPDAASRILQFAGRLAARRSFPTPINQKKQGPGQGVPMRQIQTEQGRGVGVGSLKQCLLVLAPGSCTQRRIWGRLRPCAMTVDIPPSLSARIGGFQNYKQ